MLRTTTLSLLLLLSVGIMLPFANSTAHGIRQSAAFHHSAHRHHSRAWWRRYRTRVRKRRAAALAHRNALLNAGLPQNISLTDPTAALTLSFPTASANVADTNQLKLNANNATVSLPGQMALSVVALSRPNPAFLTSREEKRMLAGVDVSDLRRIVIDKMISAGGWVTNDFVREVNGSRVFVVTAQTPRNSRSPEKAWNFYFTEVGGRIYGLTTDAPVEFADRMATEAERFIGALRANPSAQVGNR
jgi:hypothetical protein